MSDDKSKTGHPDSDRINPQERYELEYWSRKFGISQQQLKDTIEKVGSSAEAVKKALGDNRTA